MCASGGSGKGPSTPIASAGSKPPSVSTPQPAAPKAAAATPAVPGPAPAAPTPKSSPNAAPRPNVIRNQAPVTKVVGGSTFTNQTSSMTYSQKRMNNPRHTAEGQKADAAARKQSGAGDGRDAGHRHSSSGGARTNDPNNLYRQNSIQNRGGTKRYVERMRDQGVSKDPKLRIKGDSTLVHQIDRPGYGSKVPIAEKFDHTYKKNGKVIGKSSVTFGNFSSSASRQADKLAAAGKTLSGAERQRLDALDRKHFGTTTTKDQARASQMRSAPPDRAAMAKIVAAQAPGSNVRPLRPDIKLQPAPRRP